MPIKFLLCAAALAFLCPSLRAQTEGRPQAEAAVFDHKKTRVTFELDGTSVQEISAEARVLNEGGVKALAILKLPYLTGSQALDVDAVRVRKADGTVVTTPDQNIQDLPAEISRTAPMYSDLHEKHVLVKGLGVGDVLELAYRLRTIRPEFPGHFWFQYSPSETDATREETLEVRVPPAVGLKVNSPAWNPVVATLGGYRVYTWTRVTAAPAAKAPVRRMEAPLPAVQLSNFQSWEEVGRWFWDLQRPRIAPTPRLQAKAAELTRGLARDEDRIRALYDFVALKFHYISISFGLGRYQPHSADEVLENGYGDCKDKHCLLTALLKAAGFEAWPVLMGAGGRLDPGMPSPGAFNHVFTVVPLGKRLLWMDSTQEAAPMGFLNFFERDRQGLVAPPEGPASLRLVPADDAFRTGVGILTRGAYQADGTFKGHTEQTCTGDFDLTMRTFFRSCPPAQWKEILKANTAMPGTSWEMENLVPSPIEATGEPFHFGFDLTVRSTLGDNPDRIIVPPLGRLESFQLPPSDAKIPLVLGFPGEYRMRAEMTLPKGWQPALPAPVSLTCPVADFTATATMKDGTLTVEKVLVSRVAEVPARDMDTFREFLAGVRREGMAFQALNGNGAARPAGPRAENRSPHEIQGSVFLDQGKPAQAIGEFQQALAADPDSVMGHFGLAAAYALKHQGAEAVAEGMKMLRLAPRAIQPAEFLGRTFYAQLLPGETREYLTEAVRTMPEAVKLRLFLGCTLVKTDRRVEGLETLKALLAGDHPDKEDLNEAAYALAEADLDLDQALAWSRKAVQLIEGECAGLTVLDRASRNKLQTLANFWDTLGWIHFRRGEQAPAIRFLEAAWALGQHWVPGDHLAQAFQKQGRKAEAEDLFLMASVCPGAELGIIGPHYQALTGRPLPERRPDAELKRVKARTYLLPSRAKGDGYAQFDVKLSGKGFEGASFVYGYAALKADADKLGQVDFRKLFPDEGPQRILLRGILTTGGKASRFIVTPLEEALQTARIPGKEAAAKRPSKR
ncbi:DUF3857 domain-containing protein [Geothrix sp. 21YS21S-2]|uniref:DUF3857 domain-containing protein n=1 Tax=Geothrix sp. 21YS21S-2 TaxID=3068893 RepID=UPI0027BA9D37|nr:DUF3857 domain-containing protein [Geothrix sp. 21YS21S-2]